MAALGARVCCAGDPRTAANHCKFAAHSGDSPKSPPRALSLDLSHRRSRGGMRGDPTLRAWAALWLRSAFTSGRFRRSELCFPTLSGTCSERKELLFRFLAGVRLGGCEALGLFAARGAFSYIISALAVSHKTITLTLSRRVPSDFANSRESLARRLFAASPAASPTDLSISWVALERGPL